MSSTAKSLHDIRETFLSYFEKQGHVRMPSSSLVPLDDPTLLFTNAGMVQFKNIFTGLETPVSPCAVTSQKCVRAGGKHNDLENVGYTARHHTFFEMMGNFSFGDYFKEEAIYHAWQLVTGDFALDPSRLLVTVYADDDEAFGLWKKIAGLSDQRIIRIGTSDNFWSMGDTGPCGPCSEIFYDHGAHIPGGPPGSQDEDGDRFIEIWNLVFMQYEQRQNGTRVALPKPSIDTGMGLERVAALLQGSHDNYETDLFRTLRQAISDATGVDMNGEHAASHRVIADHLRASAFLIADGVLPSNEGRGYVLRRIMRRGMRHAHILGAQEPLMARIFPVLQQEMGAAYPELISAEALIATTLEGEEVRFGQTLTRGMVLLEDASQHLSSGDFLSGDVAFKLYDTYGFPVDLTADALRVRGVGVDMDGFETAMQKQKQDARAAWSGSGDIAQSAVWFDLVEQYGATQFVGYDALSAQGQVLALVKDGERVDVLKAGEHGAVILDKTPFYALSGGQVGDRGVLMRDGHVVFDVVDTSKRAGQLHVHEGVALCDLEFRALSGKNLQAEVDGEMRRKTAIHHSATHLLHEALRDVLGEHVAQKGSYVGPDRLRFDFAHSQPISSDQMCAIVDGVHRVIAASGAVVIEEMDKDTAVQRGARALFGEKYGAQVRVVQMGVPLTDQQKQRGVYSIELCGGTHVQNVSEIQLVSVLSESSVSSGVRRIEALAGQEALAYLQGVERDYKAIATQLKVAEPKVLERVETLQAQVKTLEKKTHQLAQQIAMGGAGAANDRAQFEDIGGVKFVGKAVSGVPMNALKGLVDQEKKMIGSGIVAVVATNDDGKAGLVVGVTDDLTARYSAIDFVRKGSEVLGGKGGGGRPDMAQAGGPDGVKAEDALQALRAMITS